MSNWDNEKVKREALGALGGLLFLALFVGMAIFLWWSMDALDYDPGSGSYDAPSENVTTDNPNYHGVDRNGDGADDYIRSNPDDTTTNNINQ